MPSFSTNMIKVDTITKISNCDVRPGSRYEANIHPGNRLYKQCIEARRERYRRTCYHKDERTKWKLRDTYALQVYNQVIAERSGRRGRFLKFKRNIYGTISDTNRYQVMSQSEALQKIHRALRQSKQDNSQQRRNRAVAVQFY